MEGRAPGPSRIWYWVAGAVAVLAVAVAIVAGVRGALAYRDAVDDFARVPVPGQRTVTLDSGDHRLYWEPLGGGPLVVPPLDLAVVNAVTRQPLVVSPYSGSLTYDVAGHEGTAVATVDVPTDGPYIVRVDAPPTAFLGVIAVGEDPEEELFIGIGVAVLSLIAGAVVGGVIVAVVAIARHRAYWDRARSSRPPAPVPPAPPPGAPPPPPSAQA